MADSRHILYCLHANELCFQGKRWWAQAEDPWQCLAACFEVSAAVKSGDPASYSCSLPVQQDGTCNGLQHYAALGGDLAGAEAVNLVNAERPGDVYGKVAQSVSKMVDRDAEQGFELAKMLQGKINRKTVKQTVMTTVYGTSKRVQDCFRHISTKPDALFSLYRRHVHWRQTDDSEAAPCCRVCSGGQSV